MTRLPEVTEYIGVDEIQTGNTDLTPAEWKPWSGPKERAPLPGHEHQLPKVLSLLTERRAFGLSAVLGLAGIVLGASDFITRAAMFGASIGGN